MFQKNTKKTMQTEFYSKKTFFILSLVLFIFITTPPIAETN